MECKNLNAIARELLTYSAQVKEEEVQALVRACAQAKRIFVGGAGRSGFAARAFSNRLMHLGRTVYFVGEPTTPSIQAGDLLVLGSGSGTTASLVSNAKKAKAQGAVLATLTSFPHAAIGAMADVVVTLPGATPKRGAGEADSARSIQPMGTMFEQLSWLTYDSVILSLMDILGETPETMYPRHANLE